jgi:hypothetical protein
MYNFQNPSAGGFGVNPYGYNVQGQQNGINMPGSNLGAGGALPSQMTLQNFNMQQSPGYQFQLQQGLNSVQNAAAAGGGALSGATLKAMQQYGTGLAAQDYQNMYNNYLKSQQLGQEAQGQAYNQYQGQQNIGMQNAMNTYKTQAEQAQQGYERQKGLADYAPNAANNISNIQSNLGANLAGSYLGTGMAQAQGAAGIGAAVQGGLSSLGQFYDVNRNQAKMPDYAQQQQAQQLQQMGFTYNPTTGGWTQGQTPMSTGAGNEVTNPSGFGGAPGYYQGGNDVLNPNGNQVSNPMGYSYQQPSPMMNYSPAYGDSVTNPYGGMGPYPNTYGTTLPTAGTQTSQYNDPTTLGNLNTPSYPTYGQIPYNYGISSWNQ